MCDLKVKLKKVSKTLKNVRNYHSSMTLGISFQLSITTDSLISDKWIGSTDNLPMKYRDINN